MSDDMRGLFFIVKGQYKKGVGVSFVNKVSSDVMYLGGYDPESANTNEWYMLMDSKTYHCVSCGSDFNKVLQSVYTIIKNNKGVAKNYFKHVSKVTSNDYYETHYLGRSPLTQDQRVKKAEGRCPRVSPIMYELYDHVFKEYGHYYSDEIGAMEERAYEDLRGQTSYKKSKRIMSKSKALRKTVEMTKKETEIMKTPVAKKIKKTKTKLGIRKISMSY